MGANILNPDARQENIRSLMQAAGIPEEEAAKRLEQTILITWNKSDPVSSQLVEEIIPLLERTLRTVKDISEPTLITAELVVGQIKPRTNHHYVFVYLLSDRLIVSDKPLDHKTIPPRSSLMTLIAACYATGAIIHRVIGVKRSNPPPRNHEILFEDFINPDIDLTIPLNIEESYLAGAGAIGSGFLWAIRHVPLIGRLFVTDDDVISPGNLQRQIWFDNDDLGKKKAIVLCEKAKAFLPECQLIPSATRLQDHPNRSDGAWLKRLIVAVDSRRARRALQNELPGEVFDASTTDSQEIVLHYNKQPTEFACLGCVYSEDQEEITREQIIADHLGIDPNLMREERISKEIADKICIKHPQLQASDIMGLAFDTLYKQLCSSGQLPSISGKQVIAPFAFISVLSGTLLLLQLIQHLSQKQYIAFNDWRINPWRPPVPEMKRLRPRHPSCQICGRNKILRLNEKLWGI